MVKQPAKKKARVARKERGGAASASIPADPVAASGDAPALPAEVMHVQRRAPEVEVHQPGGRAFVVDDAGDGAADGVVCMDVGVVEPGVEGAGSSADKAAFGRSEGLGKEGPAESGQARLDMEEGDGKEENGKVNAGDGGEKEADTDAANEVSMCEGEAAPPRESALGRNGERVGEMEVGEVEAQVEGEAFEDRRVVAKGCKSAFGSE